MLTLPDARDRELDGGQKHLLSLALVKLKKAASTIQADMRVEYWIKRGQGDQLVLAVDGQISPLSVFYCSARQ